MLTISRILAACFIGLMALASLPYASQALDVIRFSDFPATIYTGKTATVRLDTPEAKDYKTALQDAARGKPDFAGHFVLATWGCGQQCQYGAAIDLKTGAVTFLPGTICCSEEKVLVSYRADSSLLVLGGLLNEDGKDSYHFFVLKDGTFNAVGPADQDQPPPDCE